MFTQTELGLARVCFIRCKAEPCLCAVKRQSTRSRTGSIKMLTYAIIFLVCFVVALVARAVYQAIADTSRSVYRSKEPIAIITRPSNQQKAAVAGAGSAVAGTQAQKEWEAPAKAWDEFTRPGPSEFNDSVEWAAPKNANKPGENQPQFATSNGSASHCSLYDVDAVTAEPQVRQNTGLPVREQGPGNRNPDIESKTAARTADNDDSGKPWGW